MPTIDEFITKYNITIDSHWEHRNGVPTKIISVKKDDVLKEYTNAFGNDLLKKIKKDFHLS